MLAHFLLNINISVTDKCVNTQNYPRNVIHHVKSIEECHDLCLKEGHPIYAIECPTGRNQIECWCYDWDVWNGVGSYVNNAIYYLNCKGQNCEKNILSYMLLIVGPTTRRRGIIFIMIFLTRHFLHEIFNTKFLTFLTQNFLTQNFLNTTCF